MSIPELSSVGTAYWAGQGCELESHMQAADSRSSIAFDAAVAYMTDAAFSHGGPAAALQSQSVSGSAYQITFLHWHRYVAFPISIGRPCCQQCSVELAPLA